MPDEINVCKAEIGQSYFILFIKLSAIVFYQSVRSSVLRLN